MDNTIQEKLAQSFLLYKDKVAIEYKGRIMTYEELDIKSNMVRDWLIQNNSKPGELIGIFMRDKINSIITLIGVLKARCVIVPLDVEYPKGRLTTLLEITKVQKVVIDNRDTNDYEITELLKNPFKIISIQEVFEMEPLQLTIPLGYDINDIIYIYFTSGSTGSPKGIKGRNIGLCHFIEWEIDTFNVKPNTRVAQFTSPSHDPFLRDLFVPLCSGGTVCVPNDKTVLLDVQELNLWINNNNINLIHCTPSLFKQIIKGVQSKKDFERLYYVLLAGERIDPQTLTEWYDLFDSKIQLVNLYGPTETTLAKLFYLISKEDIHKDSIPIGKAIKGSRAIILDKDFKLCTVGITGEIYIRTPYRSHGYYNDEELTNKKFIQNPYTNNSEDLLFKTGDLGRILPNGDIEFLGRIDRQVKIRGYRIEPYEIETIIKTNKKVEEAIVVTNKSESGEIYICAYIKGPIDENSLRKYLIDRLPDYMMPKYLVKIFEVPLNPNGKINYSNLPIPTINEYTKAIGETEKRLAEIWRGIFEVDKISTKASFFELGGHSLNVMELAAKINNEFNIEISLGEVFTYPTIRELANLIDENFGTNSKIESFYRSPEKESYSLSSAQIGQYITSAYGGGNLMNNISKVIKVVGPFNKYLFEHAIRKLIDRHESLRTSFEIVKGELVQIIYPKVNFNIIELTQNYEDIERIVHSFVQPFNLRTAPLIRVGLLECDDYNLLLFDMHHIISDGYSLSIFLKEFIDLYNQKLLPPVDIQYRDFSEWQKYHYFHSSKYREDESYWKNIFSEECLPLYITTDYPRLNEQIYKGRLVEFTISKEITKMLRKSLVDTSSTLFTYLLTVYYIFLNKLTGQQDITVGTAVMGRNHPDLKNAIGMFVNTLALRNQPKENKIFINFLNEVKDFVYNSYNHQDFPFERLLEVIPITRTKGRQPLFDTMFILQNIEFPEFTIGETAFSSLDVYNDISKYDFRLEANDKDDEITFKFEYNDRLFDSSTVTKWIDFYKKILECVTNDPHVRIGDINTHSEADLAASILDFNSKLIDN